MARKFKAAKPVRKAKRKPKPYKRAEYPGQKMQIDVKYVPKYCVVDGKKITSMLQWMNAADGHFGKCMRSTVPIVPKTFCSSLYNVRHFQYERFRQIMEQNLQIRLIIVKSKHLTLFEEALLELGVIYHRIQIATTRHNGKVERQHRTDEMRFYKHMRMHNLADGRKQLAEYQRKSNNYIKTCLGMQTPNQVIQKYLRVMF